MKKIILSCVIILLSSSMWAQDNYDDWRNSDWYVTSSGELIFSWADVNNNGNTGGVITRFSAFFHLQSLVNYDFGRSMGAFAGMSLRNVGFVYDDPVNTEIRKKFRTYNLGVPIGVKFGDLKRRFIFFGYEIEFPVNYKEKTFVNGNREDVFTVAFSDRTQSIQHTVFAGFNGASGVSIKFKYYLSEFFNQNFTETIDGVAVQPYQDFEVNLFYVSLNFDLFRGTDFTYNGN